MNVSSIRPYLLLGLASAGIFLLKLGYLPLIFEEPRRALVSLEMILSGNFIMPTLNGFEYYNKPPFYNWILVVLFKLFGYHEWVCRLPTFISLLSISLLNYHFFKNKIGQIPSLLSSFFFLLSGHVLFYFSFIGEIDITYSLIVFAHVLFFIKYHKEGNIWAMFGWSYLFMVIGFLTKGLPSIAFQGMTILGFGIYYRRWNYFYHPANFIFLFSAIGLIAGYFFLYSNHSDPYPYLSQLINESSKRTNQTDGYLFMTIIKVAIEFLKITFPWCFLVIPMIIKRRSLSTEKNEWLIFGVVFVVANVWLYFLTPGTRDRYLYMFLPFIYNLISYRTSHFVNKNPNWLRISVVLFGTVLAVTFFYLSIRLSVQSWKPLALLVPFGLAFLLVLKQRLSAILGLFVIMLIARIGYDLIVFPQRKADVIARSGKPVASQIKEIIGDNRLNFYTPFSERENSLPLLGSVAIPEIERLPYDLTFYFSRENRNILNASNALKEGSWYISSKENLVSNQNIALNFRLEKKDWVLFKR